MSRLREGEDRDYTKDEKEKTIALTEEGVRKAEQAFNIENLSDVQNNELYHHILAALRANALMKRDVDYVVKDGQVVIVDEFTGRLMTGRRYSDGLHQAIEAKEHVKVERESKTLATITFQNYFRMYKKISGMTGTAKTEEEEFRGIYKLDVVTIPTNRPMIRKDLNDAVYTTEKGKFDAVADEVEKLHATGQPVLVGTVSVEKSEYVSAMRQAGLKVMRFLTDTFNLDRNDAEQRRPFNIGSYGWRTSSDSFGGPVYPQSGVDVLRVEADETLYLRGAIRYTYNLRAWVDESNDEKAGKIKRYMLGGIEGLLYRSEFELAQDLTKERLLRADFALKTARVEVLDEHPYWSVYSPGRTRSVKAVSDFRVLYNNIGEVFSSRRLKAGDVYELEYYSFAGSDEDMRNAVISAANSDDDAYAAALLLNRDIPKSVDSRLFRLVYEITDGLTEPYDAACAIRDYLRSAGTYTLTPPYPPLDMDFVSYFVLENPRGYCVYFASAMTLGRPNRPAGRNICSPHKD